MNLQPILLNIPFKAGLMAFVQTKPILKTGQQANLLALIGWLTQLTRATTQAIGQPMEPFPKSAHWN